MYNVMCEVTVHTQVKGHYSCGCNIIVSYPLYVPVSIPLGLTYSAQSSVESVCRTASMDSCSDTEKDSDWTETACLRRVYAGGDQTFATISRVIHVCQSLSHIQCVYRILLQCFASFKHSPAICRVCMYIC